MFALQAVLQRMRMLATRQQDALTAHACTDLQWLFESAGAKQAQLATVGQWQRCSAIPGGLPVEGSEGSRAGSR